MGRVVHLAHANVRRTLGVTAAFVLVLGSMAAPMSAQGLPACNEGGASRCTLPDWSETDQRDVPSVFGEVEGLVWVADPAGDAPPTGLDLLGVGVGRVEIEDAAAIRGSDQLIKLGKVKKAVRNGEHVLVRVVLDRAIDAIDAGHNSVHVITDIDGSRTDNAPTGVRAEDNPFAGSQDIYSLTYAATTGKTRLLDSNLARGWYKDKSPYAAAWATDDVLDMLVPPEAIGDGFRAATFTSGADGGYDTLGWGPAAIPLDGRVGLVPVCIEGSIANEPFTVGRLIENGQTLRNVEAPASWRGGATIPLDDDERSAVAAFIEASDDDGDGLVELPTNINLFEDGLVIRQRPELVLQLDAEGAQLAVELGLTRRGFNVLRDFEVETTGDAALDDWFERATDALSETMPPFRSTKRAGLVAGEGIGACLDIFASAAPVEDSAEASPAAETVSG